ncbi:MAG: ABC transporter ATP-binding protein [Chitinophagaceae bacterium]
MSVIRVESLSKTFGNIQAVKDLSFEVPQGSIYGFLGQNGSGKSTTIRMLLSLIHPTSGNIHLFGKNLRDHRQSVISKIGAVIERPDLYPYLTAYEHLLFFAKLGSQKISIQKIEDILKKVGLFHRKNDKVGKYSLGMKQRLGIGIALVNDPDLIILDEPTNGLDPNGIADIRNLIKMLSKQEGKTIFISSHLLTEIEQIADHILIIHEGSKIAEGSMESLFDPQKSLIQISSTNDQQTRKKLEQSDFQKWMMPTETLSMELPSEILPKLHSYLIDSGVELLGIERKNSLEDHFLRLTSKKSL